MIFTGWKLLRQSGMMRRKSMAIESIASRTTGSKHSILLTLPLTVGPGSISVAIAVGASQAVTSQGQWTLVAGMLVGSTLIAASIYLSCRFAQGLARVLGESAMNSSFVCRHSSSSALAFRFSGMA